MRLLKKETETDIQLRRDYLNAPITKENIPVGVKQNTLSLAQNQQTLTLTTQKNNNSRYTRKKRIATGFCVIFSLIGARYFWATHTPISYTETPLPVVLKPAETTPNALHYYEQMVPIMMDMNNPAQSLAGDEKYDTLKVCQEAVAKNIDTLGLLREGLKHKGMNVALGKTSKWFKKEKQGTEFLVNSSESFPSFVIERATARLLAAESRVRASKGDYAGAVNSSLDGIEFSTAVQTSDRLVDYMVLLLMQNISIDAMTPHVKHLTPTQAREALARFNAAEKALPDIRRSIVYEEKQGMRILQATTPEAVANYFAVNRYDAYPRYLGTEPPSAPAWLGATIAYGWTAGELLGKGQTGLANDWHQYQAAAYQKLSLPYQQALSTTSKLHTSLLSDGPLGNFFIINYDRTHLVHTRLMAKNQVIKAQLAMVAYQGEHGNTNPQSLSELVKTGYLEEVPLDPFSANADTPLQYAEGKVWSVGQNGINDNNTGDDDLYLR
jgi:hypothetical protein